MRRHQWRHRRPAADGRCRRQAGLRSSCPAAALETARRTSQRGGTENSTGEPVNEAARRTETTPENQSTRWHGEQHRRTSQRGGTENSTGEPVNEAARRTAPENSQRGGTENRNNTREPVNEAARRTAPENSQRGGTENRNNTREPVNEAARRTTTAPENQLTRRDGEQKQHQRTSQRGGTENNNSVREPVNETGRRTTTESENQLTRRDGEQKQHQRTVNEVARRTAPENQLKRRDGEQKQHRRTSQRGGTENQSTATALENQSMRTSTGMEAHTAKRSDVSTIRVSSRGWQTTGQQECQWSSAISSIS